MPDNVVQIGPEMFSVIAGTVVLLGVALAFMFKYRSSSSKAGESGPRAEGSREGERVSPDGFIDTFAGVISEAGGSLPFMAWVIMGATLVAYFVYLFINWKG
jgi:hypothetical protein